MVHSTDAIRSDALKFKLIRWRSGADVVDGIHYFQRNFI